MLRDAGGEFRLGEERSGRSPRGAVSIAPTDGAGQESARTLTFAGAGDATAQAVIAAAPVDLVRQANGEMGLTFRYRLEAPANGRVMLGMGSDGDQGLVDITAILAGAPVGEWRQMKLRLSCLRDAGADMAAVSQPFILTTEGPLSLAVESIRLEANEADAVCPAG